MSELRLFTSVVHLTCLFPRLWDSLMQVITDQMGASEKEVLQTDTADEDKDLDLDATIYITSM